MRVTAGSADRRGARARLDGHPGARAQRLASKEGRRRRAACAPWLDAAVGGRGMASRGARRIGRHGIGRRGIPRNGRARRHRRRVQRGPRLQLPLGVLFARGQRPARVEARHVGSLRRDARGVGGQLDAGQRMLENAGAADNVLRTPVRDGELPVQSVDLAQPDARRLVDVCIARRLDRCTVIGRSRRVFGIAELAAVAHTRIGLAQRLDLLELLLDVAQPQLMRDRRLCQALCLGAARIDTVAGFGARPGKRRDHRQRHNRHRPESARAAHLRLRDGWVRRGSPLQCDAGRRCKEFAACQSRPPMLRSLGWQPSTACPARSDFWPSIPTRNSWFSLSTPPGSSATSSARKRAPSARTVAGT